MKQQRVLGESYPGPSMFDALVMHHAELSGGKVKYAEKLKIKNSTLWRWLQGESSPLHGSESSAKDRLIDDIGMPRDDLRRLAEITVQEGCEIVLEYLSRQAPNSSQEHETQPEAK